MYCSAWYIFWSELWPQVNKLHLIVFQIQFFMQHLCASFKYNNKRYNVWIVQSGNMFFHMVQRSLCLCLIKDTYIEIETRYMKLMNCVPLIPIKSKFGRFDVWILSMWNINIQMLAEVLHKKLFLKNNKMKFIDLWSEFTPKYVPNRVIYKLNDISEAGASVISDINLPIRSPLLSSHLY
jgi:hypothetical protein